MRRFFPSILSDAVFEYRSYGLVFLWAIVIGGLRVRLLAWLLIGFWISASFHRARFYRSGFEFWRQAYKECPDKPRVLTNYVEAVLQEIERELKAGKTTAEIEGLIDLGTALVNKVVNDFGGRPIPLE